MYGGFRNLDENVFEEPLFCLPHLVRSFIVQTDRTDINLEVNITLLVWIFFSNFKTFYFVLGYSRLEKAMATHSSTLAWRILGIREPGGLPSMGSRRVGHNWNDLAAAAAAETWWLTTSCLSVYLLSDTFHEYPYPKCPYPRDFILLSCLIN